MVRKRYDSFRAEGRDVTRPRPRVPVSYLKQHFNIPKEKFYFIFLYLSVLNPNPRMT